MDRVNPPTVRIPEHRLVSMLVAFLIGRGYNVREEVPNMGQSIDVVATRGRWVTAIEVKVSDWRKGLQQCRAHQLVADFICIAVGTQSVSEALRQSARESGLGVLHVASNGLCKWDIHPSRNALIWLPQRHVFARQMRPIPMRRSEQQHG